MMVFDMTKQLAPIIWGMEGLMLFAAAWLVVTYLWQQMRGNLDLERRNSLKANVAPPKNEVDHSRPGPRKLAA